jgi:hypothetical protein
MANGGNNEIAIDFIDPLFAVALNVSFAQIFTEPWFLDRRLVLREPNIFYVATLFLAYLTVVLSWVGYHRSIKKCQISVESWSGRGRFYSDILLVFSYFVLLVSYKNFQRELRVLALIFLLYWGWDHLKRVECPETEENDVARRRDSVARRGVTVFWMLFFLLLALFYQFHPPAKAQACEDWLVLITAILGTSLYRWHKRFLWWKQLLLIFGFPRGNA